MGLLQKTSTPTAVASASFAPIRISDGDEIPIPIYQFAIYMDDPDSPVALFQNVTGMSITREVEPLTVGGENNFGREFPGHVSYGHITLGVGLSSSDFFWKWMTAGDLDGYVIAKNFTMEQRRPQPDPDGASDEEKIFEVVKRWNFENAFPVSWKISDLNLDNSNNIVIETLELSFDLFTLS
jgi:phage tail-like protein